MKYFLQLFFLAILIAVCIGFYYESQTIDTGQKIIGVAVLAFSFLWMPLFIYYRYKNKDVKDYMLTNEKIKDMNDFIDNNEKH